MKIYLIIVSAMLLMGCAQREITYENIGSWRSAYDRMEICVKSAGSGNVLWTYEIGEQSGKYYKKWNGTERIGDDDEKYDIQNIFMYIHVSYFEQIPNISYDKSFTADGDKYEISLYSGNVIQKKLTCYNPHSVYSRDAMIIQVILNKIYELFKTEEMANRAPK